MVKTNKILCAFFALAFSLMPYHYALAQSEDVERITEITVSGNQRIENETILSYMRLDKGDVISDKTMNRALKNLFNTGLFADVNLEKDGTVLKVAVKENPIVNQLFFDGNKRM